MRLQKSETKPESILAVMLRKKAELAASLAHELNQPLGAI